MRALHVLSTLLHGMCTLQVYDATGYLGQHPGGADIILACAGQDATDDFMAAHSGRAKELLKAFHIGELVACHSRAAAATAVEDGARRGYLRLPSRGVGATSISPAAAGALDPRKRINCTLLSRLKLNSNSYLLRFGLPAPQQKVRQW